MLMATNTEDVKHESEALGMTGENGGDGAVSSSSSEVVLKKGPWTAAEDTVLIEYVTKHGEGNWNAVQRNTGLARCGKSCRLRWANHLRPNLKKGAFSPEEEKLILELHAQFGNKWARMAALLPGRTDNEIKNYWNTRVKRRQRQGLPLYSNEPDHRPTNSPKATINASPALPNNATQFESIYQRYHYPPLSSSTPLPPQYSPLSSPLQPKPTISDPMIPLSSPSTSSTSPHSFIFTRPAPILCNPLGFKRFRTSSGCPLPHQSVGYSSGLGFTGQVNSGLSNIYQQQQALPFLGYDNRGGLVLNQFANSSPVKLELPSNQFSHQVNVIQQERNNVNNMQMNNTSDPLFGADHQALTSGQTTLKKRSYCCSPDERNVLDGHRGFDDLPLNSSFWSSNNAELKPKDEAQHLISKSMNEDLSSMLSDWPTGNNDAEVSNNNNNNVQSCSVINPDDNFGLDTNKPIASLFPMSTTTTNYNDNSGCYSWDDLPGFC